MQVQSQDLSFRRFQPPQQPAVNRQQSVSAQRQEALQLTLTTAEGDRVTLSAEALNALSATSDSTSAGYSAASQSKISVTVEGSLNKDELDDIRRVAQALAKSVDQARQGHFGQAARIIARAAAREDTVAQLQFHYQSSRQLSYVQRAYLQ
ncbi:MAG: hypothetical protein IT167_02440 [Bryobacterales bacterium]|nr:hypothetical protein [Bryobacterales bacterium]